MHPTEAENAIEQLRFGVPPSTMAREFTVGRDAQIRELVNSLEVGDSRSLLVHANYGAGKSHLLRVLREIALERGFVVALIIADAQGEVRFNRMDTVLGAVCREIEVPGNSEKGIGALFDAYGCADKMKLDQSALHEREKISNAGKWNFSDRLSSRGIYIALRAWVHASNNHAVRDRIEAWLSNPESYRSQRKLLYGELVARGRGKFLDTRPEWQFYADEVFVFHTGGHRQSWDALADLHRLAICSGYRGLVLLVDEFEDVIQNLPRRDYQEMAFYNLFRFFAGERFPGRAYFAVTPDFAQKCKKELMRKGAYDFDYRSFDQLPYSRLEPIKLDDMLLLAKRIRNVHETAYEWSSDEALRDRELRKQCEELMRVESPDKVRRAIVSFVALLDARLDVISSEKQQ
jgi:P-loop Domain of unknown function (DUF2791)